MSSGGFVGSLENMLFGDPVYDERGRVVKRNFGLMNAAMIVLLVVLGIGLFKGFPNMKPKSGKKKMKGGLTDRDKAQIDRGAVHDPPSKKTEAAFYVVGGGIILTLFGRLIKGRWDWWN